MRESSYVRIIHKYINIYTKPMEIVNHSMCYHRQIKHINTPQTLGKCKMDLSQLYFEQIYILHTHILHNIHTNLKWIKSFFLWTNKSGIETENLIRSASI